MFVLDFVTSKRYACACRSRWAIYRLAAINIAAHNLVAACSLQSPDSTIILTLFLAKKPGRNRMGTIAEMRVEQRPPRMTPVAL